MYIYNQQGVCHTFCYLPLTCDYGRLRVLSKPSHPARHEHRGFTDFNRVCDVSVSRVPTFEMMRSRGSPR